MKIPTIEQIEKRRAIVMADAQMKLEIADWHGTADACMDLREIEAQLSLVTAREANCEAGRHLIRERTPECDYFCDACGRSFLLNAR